MIDNMGGQGYNDRKHGTVMIFKLTGHDRILDRSGYIDHDLGVPSGFP